MAAKYPGRDIVMHRSDAADIAYRQMVPDQFTGTRERYDCERPYILKAVGLPSTLDYIEAYNNLDPLGGKVFVDIETRCRRCDNCLKHRKRLWAARAIAETMASNRTWFGTLTVNPAERFRLSLIADQRSLARGHGPLASSHRSNQFKHLVWAISPEITKWLKRVRAQSGAPLRYLLVSEAHKDGFPHFHLLIHEPSRPVTERMLRRQWRFGFSHWRLVDRMDKRAAAYVCKYLTKDALTRVRGSVRYGRPQLVAASTERMLSVTRALCPDE